MKSLIISRILNLLLCNGGSIVGSKMSFQNSRWSCVAFKFAEMKGINSDTKAFRDSLSKFTITCEDLESLSDGQLIELYEQVVRRANVWM